MILQALLLACGWAMLLPRVDAPQGSVRAVNVSTSCQRLDLKEMGFGGVAYSGYMSVKRNQSALAFILYGKANVTNPALLKNYPTLVWLNGGPGSSSQLGNLFELGPVLLKSRSFSDPNAFTLKVNNQSWVQDYNVLFVDNPVGTGLAYADPNDPNAYVTNMTGVATDFYNALLEMYNNPKGCFN
jgi:vitellogenic carboxypeptidase-like protein